MATTTNYSWTTPDDTSLVKDGAAAIRSLGSAIDTTVFNNAGAAIAKTIVDAKGDIIAATAADTVARLAVGANDTFLQADSSTATGLKWSAISAGGLTLLSTTTLSGSSTSVSITGTGYIGLYITITNFTQSTGGQHYFRLNNDTGATQYRWVGLIKDGTNAGAIVSDINAGVVQGFNADPVNSNHFWNIEIFNSEDTSSYKGGRYLLFQERNGDNRKDIEHANWAYQSTSAITNFSIHAGTGNFTGGTLKIYGVK